jgi:hypothetical protein
VRSRFSLLYLYSQFSPFDAFLPPIPNIDKSWNFPRPIETSEVRLPEAFNHPLPTYPVSRPLAGTIFSLRRTT